MTKLHDASYIKRTLSRLQGALEGVTVDSAINEMELEGLRRWLDIHAGLAHQEPFRELSSRLDAILEDGVVDHQEHKELVEWCAWFAKDQSPVIAHVRGGIDRLHGVLQGISIDKVIHPREVHGLKSWLEDMKGLSHCWPFGELREMVERILEDGVVSVPEEQELIEYCKGFSEKMAKRESLPDEDYETDHRFATKAPILESFTAICDRKAVIRFEGRRFCFTGTARSGKRKALFAMVEEAGGIPINSISNNLDYMVIGANSTPSWLHSTYGAKIEKVISMNKKKLRITIIHEDDLIDQIKKMNTGL